MTPAALEASSASAAINGFLRTAARNGGLTVQHIRHTVREPANEIWVRKIGAAFHSHAQSAELEVQVTDVPGMGQNTASSDFAAAMLRSPAAMAADPVERFVLLQAATLRDWAARFSSAPAFAHSPITVTCGVSPLVTDEALMRAADSVFLQSMADVHAISHVAAESGVETAIKLLAFVTERRENSGDFALYSLAPLSQDTRYALELLGGRLKMGVDFSHMTKAELLTESVLLARTAVASWFEFHGLDAKSAVKLADNIGSMERVMSSPKDAPSQNLKPSQRTP